MNELCVCVKHPNINDDEPNSTDLTGPTLSTFIDSVFDCNAYPHHRLYIRSPKGTHTKHETPIQPGLYVFV